MVLSNVINMSKKIFDEIYKPNKFNFFYEQEKYGFLLTIKINNKEYKIRFIVQSDNDNFYSNICSIKVINGKDTFSNIPSNQCLIYYKLALKILNKKIKELEKYY